MKNITITRTKNTVSATYLPYAAYQGALALADMLDGTIGKTADGFFKADFPTVTKAKAFVEAWTGAYEMARNERNAQKSSTSKPTATKSTTKPTTSSSKKTAPRKTKGTKPTLNDFVIANPLCTRDEAKAYGFKGTRAELKALKVALGVR